MTKLLYFDSLNEHMKKYMDDVKINDINESLQAQKIKLLRQIELSSISQAEAANKLEELKKIAIALKSNEVAPFSKTAAPELKQSFRSEEYSPSTVARYESIIKNRPQVLSKGNKSLIDELKEKLQKRNILNNTMNDMITTIEKNADKEAIKQKMNDMITTIEKNADREAISSSKASTTSSVADIAEIESKLNFNREKRNAKKILKEKKFSEKEIEQKLKGINTVTGINRVISGSGLSQRKFRSKRIL